MKKLTWVHLLLIFLSAKLALHLYVNGRWSFHRDELLYLALGRHLDWGFASVPPGIGFWAWFGEAFLGDSVEAIRFIASVFGTVTVLLIAMMAKEMLPKSEGKFAVTLVGLSGLLCGASLRTSMLFMPVVFDIFYWTLLCWLFLKYINTQKSSWLLYFGAAAGLGMLNKYSILIFLFAMLPGLLLGPQRAVFLRKQLYWAAGIALLIVSPNIVWQAAHHFPVFGHMSELAATQFVHVELGDFFADQIRFYLAALPLWLAGLYFLLFEQQAKPWRIFGWMYLTVLAVLLYSGGKSYYSLGAYPVLIAAGAAKLEQISRDGKRWIRPVTVAWMLLAGVVALPVALPLFPPEQEASFVKKMAKLPGFEGVLRWEDGQLYALPQDFADMIGWKEITDMAGSAWQSVPDKSTAILYAENYGLAGAIEQFGGKYNVPEVISFSDAYRYWLPDSINSNLKTFVYVNDELNDDMRSFFEKIREHGRLNMPLSRQHDMRVYICENPTPAFFERVGSAIKKAANGEAIDE